MTHPYATERYAGALSHLGTKLHVPEWDTYVLIRSVTPDASDATGTYPLSVLRPDADIAGGLDRLKRNGLVSVVLVLDDIHRPALDVLKEHFTVVSPFKTHFLHRADAGKFSYSVNHRYKLNRALKRVRTGLIELKDNMEEWLALYAALSAHRSFTGLHDFPREYHHMLADIDGMTAIGAWMENTLVSCHIWVSDDNSVHSHLVASNEAGYALSAAYAVNDASLAHFADARIINFGGGAGLADDGADGLARFKRGFCNATAPAYICGAILDPLRYAALSETLRAEIETAFFPAYRAPASR